MFFYKWKIKLYLTFTSLIACWFIIRNRFLNFVSLSHQKLLIKSSLTNELFSQLIAKICVSTKNCYYFGIRQSGKESWKNSDIFFLHQNLNFSLLLEPCIVLCENWKAQSIEIVLTLLMLDGLMIQYPL